ncbi:C1 family peptidase [Candidatus Woesearchaeota archaeon]|nr:C1 family peptidase [Candidatus Woesearchaeota archaeon]
MADANEIAELRRRGVRLPPVDLRRFMYQVRNQNPFGACTSFAAAAIYEYYLFRRDGKHSKDHISSPSFLWHEFRGTVCNIPGHQNPDGSLRKDRDEGGNYPDYLDVFIRKGCCREKLNEFDYSEIKYPGFDIPGDRFASHYYNRNTMKPSIKAYKDAVSRKIFRNYDELPDSPDTWLAELYNGNVLYVRIDKYCAGFFERGGDSLLDSSPEGDVGGHAMVIVGYLPDKDGKEVFIVRNSWGEGWKDHGHCYYSFDALSASLKGPVIRFVPDFTPKPLPGMPKMPLSPPMPTPGHAPTPATPPGTAPTHPPGPAPAPQPAPKPAQPTIPPPAPMTSPAPHHGEFLYQWWLFDDEAQFDLAKGRGLSPHTLKHRHNFGKKLNGPGVDDDDNFGIRTIANTPFVNVEQLISDPHNRGRIVALGACRLVELPPSQRHIASASDGFWKWTGRKMPGGAPPVTPTPAPNQTLGQTPAPTPTSAPVSPPPAEKGEVLVLPKDPKIPHPPKYGSNLKFPTIYAGDDSEKLGSLVFDIDNSTNVSKRLAWRVQIVKVKGDDEYEQITPQEWETKVEPKYGTKKEKTIVLEDPDTVYPPKGRMISKGANWTVTVSFEVPEDEAGGEYYLYCEAFDMDTSKRLDDNLIEFKVEPKKA